MKMTIEAGSVVDVEDNGRPDLRSAAQDDGLQIEFRSALRVGAGIGLAFIAGISAIKLFYIDPHQTASNHHARELALSQAFSISSGIGASVLTFGHNGTGYTATYDMQPCVTFSVGNQDSRVSASVDPSQAMYLQSNLIENLGGFNNPTTGYQDHLKSPKPPRLVTLPQFDHYIHELDHDPRFTCTLPKLPEQQIPQS